MTPHPAGAGDTDNRVRTPATILSVAHLDAEERELVLGVVLEEILSWVRTLLGSRALRALIVLDEVYGFLPPHPANPPTKRPIGAHEAGARLRRRRRHLHAEPHGSHYRALGNAGLWCLGRLQTDADRERVIDGIAGSGDHTDAATLASLLKRLSPRWFITRDVHDARGTYFLQPRWAISFLRSPMTRHEIRRARATCPAVPISRRPLVNAV